MSVRASEPVIRAVPAVTRAIAILKLLERSNEPVGVSRIADELSIVPSTCLHILRALVAEDLVAFHLSTRRYSLGTGLLALARTFLDKNDLAEAAQPVLDEVAREFGVTTSATQLVRQDHFTVVSAAGGSNFASIRIVVGASFPMMFGAAGRCVAACSEWSEAELARRFRTVKWQSPPSFEAWMRGVSAVRANGYALDVGNATSGVTVVSVPMLADRHVVTGCITALGLAAQLKGQDLKTLAIRLKQRTTAVAERIGARLFTDIGPSEQ